LIIAGQSFTVSQAGDTPPPPPVCSFTISPANKHLGAEGGSDSVTVSASASTCSWTASSNADWISVKSGASGQGAGKVSYSVDKNKQEESRTGTLSIAGKTFTVTEDGQGHGGS
jgi:hypothetical protein